MQPERSNPQNSQLATKASNKTIQQPTNSTTKSIQTTTKPKPTTQRQLKTKSSSQ